MKVPSRTAPSSPPIVEVASSSRQPFKAELEEDMRVNATCEEAVQTLVRPERIRYIPRPPKRAG